MDTAIKDGDFQTNGSGLPVPGEKSEPRENKSLR